MRVVGGKRKGHRLVQPKGAKTRPTSDRIKENIFNILGPNIYQAVVLDLFAGSGAIGIEFLSRGADRCFFCDKSKLAQKAISRNVEKTRFDDQADLLAMDYKLALKKLSKRNIKFDYIYLDPPYKKKDLYNRALIDILDLNLLKETAVVIVEMDGHDNFKAPKAYQLQTEKSYSNTKILIYNMYKGIE